MHAGGGNLFGNANGGTNRTPSQQEVRKRFGDRLVTEGSRLVTAPILLVNTRVRKHWISVSGLTRRTVRRAATRARDDRLQGYERGDFRDETWALKSDFESPRIRLYPAEGDYHRVDRDWRADRD